MKSIITLLSAFILSVNLYGQGLEISNDTVPITGDANSTLTGATVLTNKNSQPLTINWVENFLTTPPSGWTFSVCDPINCFPPTTTSGSFQLGANDTGSMHLDITPDSVTGQSVVQLALSYATNQTANIIFNVDVTMTGIHLTALKNKIIVTPNPAQNFVNLLMPQNYPAKEIIVFDLLGRPVKNVNVSSPAVNFRMNVRDLKQGMYFIQVHTASGAVFTHSLNIN